MASFVVGTAASVMFGLAALGAQTLPKPAQTDTAGNATLTAVDGLKVGSYTLSGGTTGCTVILVDGDGVPGGVAQRGGAPGTRETDLLNPLNMVDKVNAVVLSGGSAFGLDSATFPDCFSSSIQNVAQFPRSSRWRGFSLGRGQFVGVFGLHEIPITTPCGHGRRGT